MRICSVPGCGKKHYSLGYCVVHRYRFRKYGDPLHLEKVRGRGCSIEGCAKRHDSHGYCSSHSRVFKLHGDPLYQRRGKTRVYMEDVVFPYRGDDCLTWPYSCSPSGYGQIRLSDGLHIVSRLACEAINGAAPSPIHQAAHSCGNGHLGCVNPPHLRWATPAENSADMIAHGTSTAGERQWMSKLTDDDVRAIRSRQHRCSVRELARRYGVDPSTMRSVLSGETWKHIPFAEDRNAA